MFLRLPQAAVQGLGHIFGFTHGSLILLQQQTHADSCCFTLNSEAAQHKLLNLKLVIAVEVQNREEMQCIVHVNVQGLERAGHVFEGNEAFKLGSGDLPRVVIVQVMEQQAPWSACAASSRAPRSPCPCQPIRWRPSQKSPSQCSVQQ